jgi:excisionase family DNA binding protein
VPRFLLLSDVAEQLNINVRHARALVQNGELPAIKVGGRGQWRVEASEFEAYIQRKYAETRALLEERGTLGRPVDEVVAGSSDDED